MAPKFRFYKTSASDSEKFLSQELYEAHPRVRNLILVIIGAIVGINLIFTFTNPKNPESTYNDLYVILSALFISISIPIYLLSYSSLIFRHKKSLRTLRISMLLLSFAGIALALYTFFTQYNSTLLALQAKGQPDRSFAEESLSESIYILLICQILNPTWHIRSLIAGSYYIAIIVAHIQTGHPNLVWMILRYLTSLIFTIGLLNFQSRLQRRIFSQNAKLEERNQLYKSTLDKNPSCIGIISASGKLIYSNMGFDELIQESMEEFFESVTSLKLRDFSGNSSNTPNNSTFFRNYSRMSNATPDSCEESFVKQKTFFHKKLSTKDTKNTIYSFNNLRLLLGHYRILLENGRLSSDDQIIFDGKCNVSSESNNEKSRVKVTRTTSLKFTFSYEIIIRPVTEYKKLIVIINDTTQRDLVVGMETTNDYKDKILASISHELRTPLNGNLGFLQAAINDKSVPESTKASFLRPAFRSGKLLSHVIGDILDYSHLHTEGIKLNLEVKAIGETLTYCQELLENSFKKKDLRLVFKISEHLPTSFRTDHGRLTQVVLNLMSNALKFTSRGRVTVEASSLDNNHVEIRVEDTGMGIREDAIPKLFEENVSNDSFVGKGSHSKGAGLGLKVSYKLAQLLSGSENGGIRVTSVHRQGSCFRFVLKNWGSNMSSSDNNDFLIEKKQETEKKPHDIRVKSLGDYASSGEEEEAIPYEYIRDSEKIIPQLSKEYFSMKRSKGHLAHTYSKKRIKNFGLRSKKTAVNRVLIVDDDPFNIMVLESLLKQFRISRDSATNGKEAIEKVQSNPGLYKIIFMDCQMPVMDGFEATRMLTKKMISGDIQMIPIIGCTAFSGQDKIDECIKSGMREVISKPIMKDKVVEVLNKYIGLEESPISIELNMREAKRSQTYF